MRTIKASEFKAKCLKLMDEVAETGEPVVITKNGRPRTVLMAYEDYLRLAKRDRRVDLTAATSDDELAAIEASTMEPGLDHLNTELLMDKNAAD